jgi:hypothetical protein
LFWFPAGKTGNEKGAHQFEKPVCLFAFLNLCMQELLFIITEAAAFFKWPAPKNE